MPTPGLLVTVDWRWIFLIKLPIGIATIAAGACLLPEVRQAAGTRLPDAASGLALLSGVSLLVLTTGVFAAATLQRTLRAESPVVRKELFRSRQFTAATIALLVARSPR